MEDKQKHAGNKPLRKAYNKTIDFAKTYLKNGEAKNMSKKNQPEGAIEDENIETENAENTFDENEVSEMLEKIEKLTKERDEAKETMLRNVAELENFRRRSMREKDEIVQYANERLLFKFLEILDTLDKAIEAGKKSTDYAALLQGLEMLAAKTSKLFEEAGVKPMPDPVGEDFNVDLMEAMLMTPSELPEGKVFGVISRGYMYGEKVLRHAKIIASSGPAPEAKADAE